MKILTADQNLLPRLLRAHFGLNDRFVADVRRTFFFLITRPTSASTRVYVGRHCAFSSVRKTQYFGYSFIEPTEILPSFLFLFLFSVISVVCDVSSELLSFLLAVGSCGRRN